MSKAHKLPGAPGVGAGGAAALLQKYGSLAAILAAGRFSKQAEELRLYRAIATMNRKAPLPRFTDQVPTSDKAAKLCHIGSTESVTAKGDCPCSISSERIVPLMPLIPPALLRSSSPGTPRML